MIQINIRKGRASNGIKLSVLVLSLILGSCVKEEKEPEVKLETFLYTEVGPSSCIVHGKIIDMGGHVFKQYGFCYSESEDPTVLDELTRLGERTTIGSFSDTLINLASNTTYYFRAYAQTSDLVYYDDQKSFTTAPASIPVISPVSISLLTQDSAIIKGEVISDGGAIISSRGICWSNSESPTISDNFIISGTGIGVFSSTITQLSRGTTYYVRAYATNSVGTGYGEENSFTTSERQQELPVVTTTTVSGITMTTAQSGGNVTDEGGGAVTEKGVCWSTNQNPTISEAHSSDGSASGSYTSALTGLSCDTTYYVRAYATNSVGTGYGEEISFTTSECQEELPVVTTTTVSGITMTTAQSGGNVTDEGGSAVTEKGVCWSTGQNPTISDAHSSDGSASGSYTSALTGLSCVTTYYVRAYATNSSGTSYGEQIDFQTDACIVPPTVSTVSISNITETTAEGGGTITNDGGASVTEKGVCWSTDQNPTISEAHSSDGIASGSYTSAITGLSCGTTYYVRAYATNSSGTNYGEQLEFTTDPCTSVTDYDGNIYQIVTIGDQIWMQENLKVTHYWDGAAIPLKEGSSDWNNLTSTSQAYCFYENNPANKDEYGLLYTWAAGMNGSGSSTSNPSRVQGVCPSGWHLPSREEWKQLELYLGMSMVSADSIGWRGTDEGGKLKEKGFSHWDGPNTGATNSSGFTALPAGYRKDDGVFDNKGFSVGFWTSEEFDASGAWIRYLSADHADTHQNINDKNFAFSIRCVKD